jgi:hypothetical protein
MKLEKATVYIVRTLDAMEGTMLFKSQNCHPLILGICTYMKRALQRDKQKLERIIIIGLSAKAVKFWTSNVSEVRVLLLEQLCLLEGKEVTRFFLLVVSMRFVTRLSRKRKIV